MTGWNKATRIDLNQVRNREQQKVLAYQLLNPLIAGGDRGVALNPFGLRTPGRGRCRINNAVM